MISRAHHRRRSLNRTDSKAGSNNRRAAAHHRPNPAPRYIPRAAHRRVDALHGTRPLKSSAAWMAKPLLSCQVIAHQFSLQSLVSTKLPPGILPTISLLVPGAAHKFSVEAT